MEMKRKFPRLAALAVALALAVSMVLPAAAADAAPVETAAQEAMTYAATFISSQDKLRKTTFFQAADEFPRLHLIQTQ